MRHFETIEQFCDYLGLPGPNHPLITVVDLAVHGPSWQLTSPAITTDFYAFSIKRVTSGTVPYGRSAFDYQLGVMIFSQPGLITHWQEGEAVECGYFIALHKEFIEKTHLAEKIHNYSFLSYSVKEALHASAEEENALLSLCQKLDRDSKLKTEPNYKERLISYITTMLNNVLRYYTRQFEDRRALNLRSAQRFQEELGNFLVQRADALPSVAEMAGLLKMTPEYLSDMLKYTTGKTALEHTFEF